MSFGVALSGGGVRGAAHIGVLQALEERGLYPSSLSGTSAGAAIAGLYASGCSVKRMEELVWSLAKNPYRLLDPDFTGLAKTVLQFALHKKISISGLLKGNALEKLLYEESQGMYIRDAKRRIAIPAVDLVSGETVVFADTLKNINDYRRVKWCNNVLLSVAMRASCSFPSVFQPKRFEKMLLVDGGVTDNLPVDVLIAAGEKDVLAVDLSGTYAGLGKENIIEVVSNSFAIMRINLLECFASGEKLTIRPQLSDEIGLLDFALMPGCMEEGYRAAMALMPQIEEIFHT